MVAHSRGREEYNPSHCFDKRYHSWYGIIRDFIFTLLFFDTFPQHRVAMRHSKLLLVQLLTSTTISCSLVLIACIPTPLSTKDVPNARSAGESRLKYR